MLNAALASSPDHTLPVFMLKNIFQCVTLKNWEWHWDEAKFIKKHAHAPHRVLALHSIHQSVKL